MIQIHRIGIIGSVIDKKPIIKVVDYKKLNIKSRDWFPFRDINLYGNIDLLSKSVEKLNLTSFKEGIKKTFEFCKKNNLLKTYKPNEVEIKLLNKKIK